MTKFVKFVLFRADEAPDAMRDHGKPEGIITAGQIPRDSFTTGGSLPMPPVSTDINLHAPIEAQPGDGWTCPVDHWAWYECDLIAARYTSDTPATEVKP